MYLLGGDFKINLSQNWYNLDRKGAAVCQSPVHTLVNKFHEFCQIFSLNCK